MVLKSWSSEYSTQLNASRLKLLQAQDDLVRKMKDAAEKQLKKVGSSENEEYPKLLEALIIQVSNRHCLAIGLMWSIMHFFKSRYLRHHSNGCCVHFISGIETLPVLKGVICGHPGFVEAEGALGSAALS